MGKLSDRIKVERSGKTDWLGCAKPNNSFNRSANSIAFMRETWLYLAGSSRPVNSGVRLHLIPRIGKRTYMLYQSDTKFIDLAGALAAGLTLQYQSWSSVSNLLVDPGLLTADNLKHAALYMAACALAALIVFLWKGRVRRKIGWVLIAFLSAGLCTGGQEYFAAKAFEQKPMALFEGYEFTLLSFMFTSYTTLLVMGIVHYGGVLLREASNRMRARL
jgi:hypothetical protein